MNYSIIRNQNSNPRASSLQSWFEDYPNTKVIRINDKTKANAAGKWATEYVRDYSKATYAITLAINSLDPTYCSKIVWQAYAKTGNVIGTATSGIKAPAVFLKRHNYPGAVPKVIYSTGADFGSVDF